MAADTPIRLFMADDHSIVRDGLRRIFAETPDIQVVGETDNRTELLRQVRSEAWDVLLLDLSLPGGSGLDTIRQLLAVRPDLKILVLTMHEEGQYAVRVVRAGARGYQTKGRPSRELLDAIRQVAAGGRWMSPALAVDFVEQSSESSGGQPLQQLSNREYEIFLLTARGRSATDIGQELHISTSTVSTYRHRILTKLGKTSTAELVQLATQLGLVE